MKKLLGYCALITLGATGTATAQLFNRPQGEFKTFIGSLEYDPTRSCFKPTRPYGNDRYAAEAYIQQAKRYLDCMQEAAEHDLRYAEKVIVAGHEKAADEFLSEVRRGL